MGFLIALVAGCGQDYSLSSYNVRVTLPPSGDTSSTPPEKSEIITSCQIPTDEELCEGNQECSDSLAQATAAFNEAQSSIIEAAGFSVDEYYSGETPVTLYTLSSDSAWAYTDNNLYSDIQISMNDNTGVFEDPTNISPDNNLSRTRCEAYEDDYGTLVRSVKVYAAQPDETLSHQIFKASFETNNQFQDVNITGQFLTWCAGDETVSCSGDGANVEYPGDYTQSPAYGILSDIVEDQNVLASVLSQAPITDTRSYGLYFLE